MTANICSSYIVVHMFEKSNAECSIWLLYFSNISQFIPSLIEVRVFLARLDKKDRNWNGKIVLADSNQEKDFNGVMELIRIIENMLDEKSGVQVSHYVGKNN